MRIVRNERHIRTRSFIGRYVPWVGILAVLIAWLISITNPSTLFAVLVILPVGLVITMAGGYFADRYAGPLAHHSAVVKTLKGLDDQYILVQYLLPASHVLVEPGGCTTFVVKTQGGQVIYSPEKGGRWKHVQRGKFWRQFAGQEGIGLPDFEAERQAERLRRWLARKLPDVEVPVRGVVVFVHPNVALEADESPVPALLGKKLKPWLRGPGRLKPLPDDVRRRLAEVLDTVGAG
jgi:hypothetical protein